MKNLIPHDISRCNNHRCALRSKCARYMQLKMDNQSGKAGYITVSRFGRKDGNYTTHCEKLIDIPK